MKILRNKRGEDDASGMSHLVVLILISISAIVLIIFAISILSPISAGLDRNACRAGILAQSQLLKSPLGGDLVNPDCLTYNLKFYEDKIEINGKRMSVFDSDKNSYVKSFDSLNNEIVNKVIAEELRLCWWQFLEGKNSIWGTSLTGISSESTCFICNEIYFDQTVKKNEFTGFFNFTKNNTIPKLNRTYYQYYAEEPRKHIDLYDWDPDKNSWEEFAGGWFNLLKIGRTEINKDITFDKNKIYVVYFAREGVSQGWFAQRGQALLETVTDVANPQQYLIKKAIPTPERPESFETYFAYVISQDEIPNQCDNIKLGGAK